MVARVNNIHLPFIVHECDDLDTCHGGTCWHGDLLYDGVFTCNCTGTQKEGPFCLTKPVVPLVVTWDGGLRDIWAEGVFGQSYYQPKPAQVSISGGINTSDNTSVTYLANGLPCGIVMDAATGALSGMSRDPVDFANVTVLAIGVSGESAMVNNAPFHLTVIDCDGTTTCNGGICVDNTQFDGEFECNCTGTGRQGTFCTFELQQEVQAATTDTRAVIGISAGASAVALLLIAVLAIRRCVHVSRPTGKLANFPGLVLYLLTG